MNWYKGILVLFLNTLLCSLNGSLIAQTELSDSLKSIFMDVNIPAQARIEAGSQLVKEIAIVEDNIKINMETERLILENTNATTLNTNLYHLFDLLTIRSVLYKLGQDGDAALETISATKAVAEALEDRQLLAFSMASELYQSAPGPRLDSLLEKNLSLYKNFLISKKSTLAGLCLQNAGDVEFIKKNYGDALNYYKKSLSLQNVHHSRLIAALLNTQIGQCYLALGSNEIATSYLDAAYQMHLLEGNKEEQAINLYYIAKAYFNKGDSKTAEAIINKVRLVTSMLKDTYFKKLLVVQLSAIANIKQEEQLQKLFTETGNRLNGASILPENMLAPAAADVYSKNVELMKQNQNPATASAKNVTKRPGLVFLLIALGGVIVFFGALKLFNRKKP